MALNWVQVTPDRCAPVPLLQEKTMIELPLCNVKLTSHPNSWPSTAGTLYLTNKRLIFIRMPPSPAALIPGEVTTELHSFSAFLNDVVDGRYVMPIFTAPRFECKLRPVRGGGLDNGNSFADLVVNRSSGGLLQLSENVIELRERMELQTAHMDSLPLYAPPSSESSIPGPSLGAISQGPTGSTVLAAHTVAQADAAHEAARQPQNASSTLLNAVDEGPPAYESVT